MEEEENISDGSFDSNGYHYYRVESVEYKARCRDGNSQVNQFRRSTPTPTLVYEYGKLIWRASKSSKYGQTFLEFFFLLPPWHSWEISLRWRIPICVCTPERLLGLHTCTVHQKHRDNVLYNCSEVHTWMKTVHVNESFIGSPILRKSSKFRDVDYYRCRNQ